MNGHVSLTSDSHSAQLVQTFGDLFRNKILTDVTLLCEDRSKIDAHKVVLCAGSNFFREFFTNNTNDNLILYMRGIPKQQLLPLIQFLYIGETTVSNAMPCLESYDVKMRKKDICYTGGTSTIKYHMERYHKDLIGASYVNPMNVNSQQI